MKTTSLKQFADEVGNEEKLFRVWLPTIGKMSRSHTIQELFEISGGDISGYSVMQAIGINDKNDIPVFEDDIVRILYTDWPSNTDPNIELEDYLVSLSHVGIVTYNAPSFFIRSFEPNRYDEYPYMNFNYGAHGRLEVIGNKYENPELID